MSILRRLWPRRRAADRITMGVYVVEVPKPIPLAEREPNAADYGNSDAIWYGQRHCGLWLWDLRSDPIDWHTHWLPASVETLPARCCPPEVG